MVAAALQPLRGSIRDELTMWIGSLCLDLSSLEMGEEMGEKRRLHTRCGRLCATAEMRHYASCMNITLLERPSLLFYICKMSHSRYTHNRNHI